MDRTDAATERLDTPAALFVRLVQEARATEVTVLQQLEGASRLLPSGDVRSAIQRHSSETQAQIERLDRVLTMLDAGPASREGACTSVVLAATHALDEASDAIVETTALVYASQTEFLEVAIYNGLVQIARGLGLGDISAILQLNLEEEQAMRQTIDAALYERAQRLDTVMGMPEVSENNATLHGYE